MLQNPTDPSCSAPPMSMRQRQRELRSMCPCRSNTSQDEEGWRHLFDRARFGSYAERKSAAHSIGTLLERSNTDPNYTGLVKKFQVELDALMRDPRSASQLLGVMKPHGHARRGAARRGYRKVYRAFSFRSRSDLAKWLNEKFNLQGKSRLTAGDKAVRKLASWVQHRTEFQPTSKLTEKELLHRVQKLLPQLVREVATH